jgi:hypothetical protein
MQRLEVSGAVRHTHTHTHTYIYIYIYICVCVSLGGKWLRKVSWADHVARIGNKNKAYGVCEGREGRR